MASTAWTFPGTTSSVSNKFSSTFLNSDNVKLDDAVVSNASMAKVDENPPVDIPEQGPELITTNYGFTIPYDSYITGIEIKIEGHTGAGSGTVGELAYLADSTYIGTYKDNEWGIPVATPGTHIYGSPTDLWGLRLTPTLVNSTNFGWIFMAYEETNAMNVSIDYMQMKIHYLPAGATMMGSGF